MLKSHHPLGLWLQWAGGQIRFGFEANKAIIFDVLPDSEDKDLVNSQGQVYVPFVGFTTLSQQVAVALDQRCLEGSNFRKLPQMEQDWSHVTINVNQLHLRRPLLDESTTIEAAAKVVNEEEKSTIQSGILGLFIRLAENQTLFLGMPINYDYLENYSFIYNPSQVNTNETEEENSTLAINSQDVKDLWEEGSNLEYNMTVSHTERSALRERKKVLISCKT